VANKNVSARRFRKLEIFIDGNVVLDPDFETEKTCDLEEEKPKKRKKSLAHSIWTIIGICLCAILIPMLIVNCSIIISSLVGDNKVPNAGGYASLIVTEDGLYEGIHEGDLIIVRVGQPSKTEVGDVMLYFAPSSGAITVREIAAKSENDGKYVWMTRSGKGKSATSSTYVTEDEFIGVYPNVRIAKLGSFVLFLSTPLGFLIFVGIPALIFILYDSVRSRRYEKKRMREIDELVAELEALKAEKELAEQASSNQT
jgi:signal peptidase